jgi:ribosomal protein L21
VWNSTAGRCARGPRQVAIGQRFPLDLIVGATSANGTRIRLLGAAAFPFREREEMSSNVVYAIVKAGGRQEKVSVGDVVVVDKLAEGIGSSVSLKPLMLVDGDAITVDAAKLGGVTVKAEVVDSAKGPKISIIKYKNKTGYRKRQGHRQKMSVVKITEIA